jgi:large subunit ribosomal protein L4
MAEGLSVTMRNQRNEPLGEIELPPAFASPARSHLLYEAVKMQRANRRAGAAATKTRGMVSGGGRKPWRQKGTGRARAGSNRSPIWVGGATIFGPQPRDYSYRLPRSGRRRALEAALAVKARDEKVLVLDKIELPEIKTKELARLLGDLGVSSALILIPEADPKIEKSARNLPRVKVLRAEGANPYDLLRFEHLVLTQGALEALAKRLES